MTFGLSTRWNAYRHKSGVAMIEEILALGLDRVELGYDLTIDLVPGVQQMVDEKAVSVDSVHAFCPVPVGAPYGHPELFTLVSLDKREREIAASHLDKTINFAAHVGARTVVLHAGNVEMKNMTRDLVDLYADGKEFSPRYEKLKTKLLLVRDKKAEKHLHHLRHGIEALLPLLEETGIALAIENLPSWESVPTELETEDLMQHFGSPHVRYWHDMGHAQLRQELGFISHTRWLKKLAPYLAGIHIHDMAKPAMDHIMPPNGEMDFRLFKPFIKPDVLLVLEPRPGLPAADLTNGMEIMRTAWN
jgi:sugar phosphate isomerase/epimerase